jgi:hypothetical protein
MEESLDDLSGNPHEPQMSEEERRAVTRVRRSGVTAPTSAILSWVRSVGTKIVMSSKYSDIRAVADAF